MKKFSSSLSYLYPSPFSPRQPYSRINARMMNLKATSGRLKPPLWHLKPQYLCDLTKEKNIELQIQNREKERKSNIILLIPPIHHIRQKSRPQPYEKNAVRVPSMRQECGRQYPSKKNHIRTRKLRTQSSIRQIEAFIEGMPKASVIILSVSRRRNRISPMS